MKEKSLRGILVGTIVLVFLIALIGTKSINNTYAIDNNEFNNIDGVEVGVVSQNGKTPGDLVFLKLNLDRSRYTDNVVLTFQELEGDKKYSVFVNEVDTTRGEPHFIIPLKVNKSSTYVLTEIKVHDINNPNSGYIFPVSDHLAEGTAITFQVVFPADSKTPDEFIDAINLNSFRLRDNVIYYDLNEKPGVKIDYDGYYVSASLVLTSKDGSFLRSASISDLDTDRPYFELPNVISGKYDVSSITLCSVQLYCKTFTENPDGTSFGTLEVLRYNESASIELTAINLNTNDVKPGNRVEVDVNANDSISSALLVFYNKDTNKTFSAYVKNIKGNGYFILPSTVEAGNYRLQNIVIKNSNGASQSTTVPGFEGNSYTDDKGVFYENMELSVKEDTLDSKDSLVFNNEEYDDLINKKIESLSDTAVITVICDNAPLVRSTLFKKIAETRKTLILQYGDSEWVFNGTDIVDPKYIDVSMLISSIKNSSEFGNSNISNLISEEDTSVLSFANNGTLPGKALIRLNSTELDSKFGNKDIFVYYYNTEENKLFKIALEVQKIEGYYEFYINHNSDYVLSTKELEGDYVVEDKELLNLNSTIDIKVSDVFSSTKATIIALVCVVLIAVIAVVSLLHIVKHGKYVEKKDNKVNKKGKK